MQVDSHTQFSKDWDVIFEEQFNKISLHAKDDDYFAKPIITSYPRSFKVLEFDKRLYELKTGDKHTQIITYRKDSLFLKGSFSRQIGIPTKCAHITHAMLMAAGCIFTKGSFVKEIQASNPIFTTSIDDINQRGTFRIEDYLSSLPVVNPGNSAFHSNFSTGTSSVSIRGLGGDRSLVLIDGKRLPSRSPLDGNAAQDLNQVPFALIKKVEILTGGKSTIYGSDATGGVINFILDKKYSGTKISIHQGAYQHNNNSYLRNINNDAKSSVFDGINSNYSIIFGR